MNDTAASTRSKSERDEARVARFLGAAFVLGGAVVATSTLLRAPVHVAPLLTACFCLLMGAGWIVEGRGRGRSLWLWTLALAAVLARLILFPM